MGRTQIWILAWAALTGAASLLHAGDLPDIQHLAADLPTYLPSLLLGAAGQLCLYRAIRSFAGSLWGGPERKPRGKSSCPQTSHFAAHADEPVSDFDADAAFARYMERRKAQGEEEEPPLTPPAAPVRIAGGFGRKVV